MRRVVMLSSEPLGPPWNGADKNFAALLVRADDANHYTIQAGRRPTFDLAHVTAVPSRFVSDQPTAAQKLRGLVFLLRHSRSVDLIHLVASLANPSRLVGPTLRAWSTLQRTPIVHTIPSIGDRPILRRNFVGNATVVVSEYSRQRLLSQGVPNVFRVYPPLDAAALVPHASPDLLAQQLALGQRAVVYPGHYGEDGGVAEIIQAFARLPPDCDDAVLVLSCRTHVGQHAALEAEKAEHLAHTAGIASRVRVLGQVADMPTLLAACAVTVLVPRRLTSKMDLPLVLLESLALERPVIVIDRPPLNEVLIGGGGGLLIPPDDIASLVDGLTRLLRSPDLRYQLAHHGRIGVRDQCQPTTVVARYHEIYDEVLTRVGTRQSGSAACLPSMGGDRDAAAPDDA